MGRGYFDGRRVKQDIGFSSYSRPRRMLKVIWRVLHNFSSSFPPSAGAMTPYLFRNPRVRSPEWSEFRNRIKATDRLYSLHCSATPFHRVFISDREARTSNLPRQPSADRRLFKAVVTGAIAMSATNGLSCRRGHGACGRRRSSAAAEPRPPSDHRPGQIRLDTSLYKNL
ncbi:hypothetical protein EVAR_92861_1 [Eumeta japonica]|uniref:Uncharacterized protein n=1 Tax=Eumeta variegata TaxID=151549 RepID=A0A4C1T9Z2_EUMVA|nr:hypothetical protein EVAR_92861_1 [Eumeta japonica]